MPRLPDPRAFAAFCLLTFASFAVMRPRVALAQEGPVVPDSFSLSEPASKALEAAWLTDDERHAMRVFHGVWDDRDLTSPRLRAMAALNAWDFGDPVWGDPQVPVELAAEAKVDAGEFEQALDLLKDGRSNAAARLRAQALLGLGRKDDANREVDQPVKALTARKITDPAELTEGVRALAIRARIQGQPARDFQSMMNLLARAGQEIDQLYWPSRLVEAELLLDKDNPREGVAALHEALSLNPRCGGAWYQLGRVAMDQFDFDGANRAAAALRRLNPRHPLADLLAVEAALVQDDPETAMQVLDPLLARLPRLRPALALRAAAQAILYDEAAAKKALDAYDAISPGAAEAQYETGRHLSMHRQYEMAAAVLEEAIRREPAWPAPQIELGLMELQSGRDEHALQVLRTVVKLDPFNKRAANSLHLLEEIAKYRRIESEHFIVSYQPGEDQVVAEMMPPVLERIHSIVAGRFKFEPKQKTLIEVHPNHQRFAVRITGMPFVHTIAACTGPVIAMEVPREGAPNAHQGLFDWPRVIQHEYTHTITLGQTRNRIPHWLTEGAAVSMEPSPRAWETQISLAQAWRSRSLFSLDEIKWAFVRPKRPGDRGLAYAQGHWMVQYMNERFGEQALIDLLERYDQGQREAQAIPSAFGVSRARFFHDFLEWAGAQVKSWGLAPSPSLDDLSDELRESDADLKIVMRAFRQARLDAVVSTLTDQVGSPSADPPPGGRQVRRGLTAGDWPELVRPPVKIPDETLAAWLGRFPDQPELLEIGMRRRLENLGERFGPADIEVIKLIERYAAIRPGDPFPHKRLAQMWLASDTPQRAVEHLEFLDAREEKSPVYAIELANLYRKQGDLEHALAKATRAVLIDPYDAADRELAATIALEKKDYAAARLHIVALTILEPDRPQHAKRLEAIDKLIGG